jgi:hypothetical protein
MQLQQIEIKIYEVRGHKIMLDFDLSEMYEVENRALKQSVKRNIDRFPSDFMFQLTKIEWQEVITNCDNLLKMYNSVQLHLLRLANKAFPCYQVY